MLRMNTQELNEFFKKKEEFEAHSAILEERMKSYLSINRNINVLLPKPIVEEQ